jgi:hypothetical protein
MIIREESLRKNQTMISIILHLFLLLATALLGIELSIYNPSYLLRLILPGQTQPLGWIFSVIILLLFGLLIAWALIVPRRTSGRRGIHKLILFLVFVIMDFVLDGMIYLGPAFVLLLTSPVGKLFY